MQEFDSLVAMPRKELPQLLALSSYARLNEERCGILGDIKERGQIHG